MSKNPEIVHQFDVVEDGALSSGTDAALMFELEREGASVALLAPEDLTQGFVDAVGKPEAEAMLTEPVYL